MTPGLFAVWLTALIGSLSYTATYLIKALIRHLTEADGTHILKDEDSL